MTKRGGTRVQGSYSSKLLEVSEGILTWSLDWTIIWCRWAMSLGASNGSLGFNFASGLHEALSCFTGGGDFSIESL